MPESIIKLCFETLRSWLKLDMTLENYPDLFKIYQFTLLQNNESIVILSSETLNTVLNECYQLKTENIPVVLQLLIEVGSKWLNLANNNNNIYYVLRSLAMLLSQCGETVITYLINNKNSDNIPLRQQYIQLLVQYFDYNDGSISSLLFDFWERVNVYILLYLFLLYSFSSYFSPSPSFSSSFIIIINRILVKVKDVLNMEFLSFQHYYQLLLSTVDLIIVHIFNIYYIETNPFYRTAIPNCKDTLSTVYYNLYQQYIDICIKIFDENQNDWICHEAILYCINNISNDFQILLNKNKIEPVYIYYVYIYIYRMNYIIFQIL